MQKGNTKHTYKFSSSPSSFIPSPSKVFNPHINHFYFTSKTITYISFCINKFSAFKQTYQKAEQAHFLHSLNECNLGKFTHWTGNLACCVKARKHFYFGRWKMEKFVKSLTIRSFHSLLFEVENCFYDKFRAELLTQMVCYERFHCFFCL